MLGDLRYRLRALFRRGAARTRAGRRAALPSRSSTRRWTSAPACSREEALRRARLAFGGLDAPRRRAATAAASSSSTSLGRDLRYAVAHAAHAAPIFTVVAVVSLALGIGANTAMFQLLNALVLRPLPVARPAGARRGPAAGARPRPGARQPVHRYPARHQPALGSACARASRRSRRLRVGRRGLQPRAGRAKCATCPGCWVSGDFFPVLGLTPAAGRLFTAGRRSPRLRPARRRRQLRLLAARARRRPRRARPHADRRRPPRRRDRRGAARASTACRWASASTSRCRSAPSRRMRPAQRRRSRAARPGGSPSMGRLQPGWTIERADAHIRTLAPAIFKATLPTDYPAVSVARLPRLRLRDDER